MYKCNDDYENIKRKIEEERKKYKGIRVILDLKEKGVFQALLVLMLE
jgi:hypothetical protein